jgi:excisionase family DNA binding protein
MPGPDGDPYGTTSLGRSACGKVTSSMARAQFEDSLLTVGEVAQIMRVSNMTVYRLIKAGQISAIRVGKNYRIRGRDVERYLSERAVQVEEDV